MAHVLLIDEGENRQRVVQELEHALPGLVVTPVTSAAALAQALADRGFDLAIADHQLSWSDGLAVLHAIRSRTPGCAVILFSDHHMPAERVDAALRAGLDDYLPRSPHGYARLALVVQRALERAATQRRLAELEAAHKLTSERALVAQAHAEATQRRLASLVAADALLAATLDYPSTLRQVANLVVPTIADWCAVDLLDATGQLQRLAVAHTDPTRIRLAEELHQRYPPDPQAPRGLWQIIRTRQPELYPAIDDTLLVASARDEAHLSMLRAVGMTSAMLVPLLARDQVLGVLTLVASDSGHRYGPDDLSWAEALARRSATAIDHARLYAEARAAEAESRAQAEHSAVLAEASAAFADTSLGVETVLAAVARQVAERIGDSCSISLLSPDGEWLVPLATYHVDPHALELIRRLVAEHPVRVRESISGQVLQRGEPLLIPQIAPEQLRAMVRSEYSSYLNEVGIASVLIAPLRAAGRTLGTLTLTRAQPDQSYTAADQTFLQDLAARAALAIANAQLYAAVTEQREWFRTTLASIGDAVIVTDAAGSVRFLNAVAEVQTGWPATDAIGQPVSDIFRIVNEETRATVESPVDKVLREGMIVGLANHTMLLARDGRALPIDDSGAPIRDGDGRLTGVVLVFRDITERRQAERELRQSRDQLAIILRGITDGITVQDRSGALIYANDAAAQLSGFATAEEMLATPPLEIVGRFAILDADGSPLPLEQLPGRLALQGQAHPERELRFLALLSGVERWSAVSATPAYDEHGAVVLAVNIFRDITAQKRAALTQRFLSKASVALAASLDETTTLRTVTELVVPALADWCVVDLLQADGTLKTEIVTHTDPQKIALGWEVVRRYPLDPDAPYGTGKVIRTRQSELMPDVPDSLLDAIAQDADHPQLLRALGFRSYMCVPLLVGERALGTLAFVGARARRFGSDDLALAEELARRIATTLDNARLYTAAQEAITARDQFLSIASHELKTPLTSLLGYVNILQRRLGQNVALSPRDLRALQVIETQGHRLNTLILSLLDLSRLQAGQLSIQPEPLDLNVLARQVVEEAEPTLDHHTLHLRLPAETIMISGDGLRLEQVVQNLLHNAVKYSPDGGEVVVEVFVREATACLAVRDEGIGIPATALPQLFRRFYRASNVDGSKISGTGVGLYVVREIMTLHGGTVEVASQEGVGSTFTLCFPYDPTVLVPAHVDTLPSPGDG